MTRLVEIKIIGGVPCIVLPEDPEDFKVKKKDLVWDTRRSKDPEKFMPVNNNVVGGLSTIMKNKW